jgi:hypothetical protein
MRQPISDEIREIIKSISADRRRTNLLRNHEQRAIAFFLQRVPSRVTSDMLTFLGFIGTMITFSGFVLATIFHRGFLLLGVAGFAINWLGDSLDGRLAYYRNKPRKWYGFSLDLSIDWVSTIILGWGYVLYAPDKWEMVGSGFVVLYGWAMIVALVRYKVTGNYTIDSGILGPTELRIIISAILIAEVFVKDAILYAGAVACLLLFIIDIRDTLKLIRMADEKDIAERENNLKNSDDKN